MLFLFTAIVTCFSLIITNLSSNSIFYLKRLFRVTQLLDLINWYSIAMALHNIPCSVKLDLFTQVSHNWYFCKKGTLIKDDRRRVHFLYSLICLQSDKNGLSGSCSCIYNILNKCRVWQPGWFGKAVYCQPLHCQTVQCKNNKTEISYDFT